MKEGTSEMNMSEVGKENRKAEFENLRTYFTLTNNNEGHKVFPEAFCKAEDTWQREGCSGL